uniref:Reverse transcriptase domain-containing protein n=1 Tax=Solanum lycopersicum TaxID=4081 RepID=A0A3Q7HLE8_SOLLC
MRPVIGWRVCMDYRKLNAWTEKDHFPMPFMDQMLDRLARNGWYCFLDGYSGYNQISIATEDQEKTTFTCPYGTFAFKRMSFGLCNAPATFQRYPSDDLLTVPFLFLSQKHELFTTSVDITDGCAEGQGKLKTGNWCLRSRGTENRELKTGGTELNGCLEVLKVTEGTEVLCGCTEVVM